MRSLDTNVFLRFLLQDDPRQALIASAVLEQTAFMPLTVALELFWALTNPARWTTADAIAAFRDLFEIPTLAVEARDTIIWALGRTESGADFADMLHLGTSSAADSFATFDRGIGRHAAAAQVRVEQLG